MFEIVSENVSDEERIQCHLDTNSDDWTSRLVLADLLEEQGRSDDARCQRWMIENRNKPYKGPVTRAAWFDASKVDGEQDPESNLTSNVFRLLKGGIKHSDYRTYEGRQEAEADLAQALKETT